MTRRKACPTAKAARNAAREAIVQAVNRHVVAFWAHRRLATPYTPSLLSVRHINRAVKIARHHGLVPDTTLTDAGFRRSK